MPGQGWLRPGGHWGSPDRSYPGARRIASPGRAGLSVCGLAANGCDRDMPHRRIGLGAMPMTFTGLDMHDIADVDLALFMLVCHHAGPGGHDQHLVAVMRMPSCGATLAEVHHAAVIIRGVPGLNDGLA